MTTITSTRERAGTRPPPRPPGGRDAQTGARRLSRRRLTEQERQEEFRQAALPYLPRLYATAARYAWQPADADDLVQEALTKAYAAFDQLEPGTNLLGWLCRILVNTHHSQYAKRQRRASEVPLDSAASLPEDMRRAHEQRNAARKHPSSAEAVHEQLARLRVHLSLLAMGRVSQQDEPLRLAIQVERLNEGLGRELSQAEEVRIVLRLWGEAGEPEGPRKIWR